MEVPEWGTAPEADYPSLLPPDNTPASDNARKKAKRKQKQQQEHLQHLMHVPVHFVSTSEPSGQCGVFAGHMPSSPTWNTAYIRPMLQPVKTGLRVQAKLHLKSSVHSRSLTCFRYVYVLLAGSTCCVILRLLVPPHTPDDAAFWHRQKLMLTGTSTSIQRLLLQQVQPASLW